jgi:integrase
MADLKTVASRRRLPVQRDPHFDTVRKGHSVGFRRMTLQSLGTWSARAPKEGGGGYLTRSLGEFADVADHLRYDAALKAANEWFDHLDRGGSSKVTTVRDACDSAVVSVKAARGERASRDVKNRLTAYVLNDAKLADLELMKLTPKHLERWRASLMARETTSGPNRGKQRSDATMNRDMTAFRAALNLAYRDGHVSSDFAWRGKLQPIKGAERRRTLYLDREQRRRLVAKAPADLAQFLHALCLLPLRPGAAAALVVANYDRRLHELVIAKDKAGADRRVKLPAATAEFFDKAVRDKLPQAPIFARANGKRWDRDAWKRPTKAAVLAAELPAGVTVYVLRHSLITDLISAGLNPLSVAELAGTSVTLIQRNYAHLRADLATDALAGLAL